MKAFIDRTFGGRLFRGLIERAGIEVHLHDEHFRHKAEDPDWLAQLGASGWLLVSGDNDVTRQPLFLHQLSASKAHVFVMLALNGASPAGKAGCIVRAYKKNVRTGRRKRTAGLVANRPGRSGAGVRFSGDSGANEAGAQNLSRRVTRAAEEYRGRS
jgi:PIN like domain